MIIWGIIWCELSISKSIWRKGRGCFCCTLFSTQNAKRNDREKKNKENLASWSKDSLFCYFNTEYHWKNVYLFMSSIFKLICSKFFDIFVLIVLFHGALYQYQTLYINIDGLMLKFCQYRVSITSAFRMRDRERNENWKCIKIK